MQDLWEGAQHAPLDTETCKVGAQAMKEITGELWDYYKKPNYNICLTVNGTIKANGEAVMGRGCALEAQKQCKVIAGSVEKIVRKHGTIMPRRANRLRKPKRG
jgi:hypothetical protein